MLPKSIQHRHMLSCGNQVPNSHQAMPHSLRLKTLLPSTVSLLEGLTVQYSTRMQRWVTAKPSAAMLKVAYRTGAQHWFCAKAQLWPGTGSGLRPLVFSCEQVWFLQDGPWSVFSSNQPLKSCWFGQILLNIQWLNVWKTFFWWLELQCRPGHACSVASPSEGEVRWKRNSLHECRAIPPWLCPVQSYQAGNSASSWVCWSLRWCNQEEMKVPNCASCTILPLHRLLAFANEANSRSSPGIRSSAKTSHNPMPNTTGDKGNKEAHTGPVLPVFQGIDIHWPAALSAGSQQMLHTHPCALPHDSYGLKLLPSLLPPTQDMEFIQGPLNCPSLAIRLLSTTGSANGICQQVHHPLV